MIKSLRETLYSPMRRAVLKNIVWAVTGKCVSLFGTLVVGIIVARYLGKEQYGLMNYVISFVAIFQVLADFGLDHIQIREEAAHPEKRDVLLGSTFILKIVFAIFSLFLIAIVLFLFEADSRVITYVLIYSLSILLNTTWVSRNHFTSIVWNEYIVKTEISRTLIGMAVKVFLLLISAPLSWFIWSLLFDSFLLAVGYTVSYNKKIDSIQLWRFDFAVARYMLGQSFPLLLSGAAIVVYNRIDQIMIGKMLDNSEVGIYSVAVRFLEVLTFVPTIISQTVSPVLVKLYSSDKLRYQQMSQLFMDATVMGCLVLALLTSLLAYPIVYYSFGQVYLEAVPVLSIIALKVWGDALSQTSGQLIIIEGRQKYASIRNLIGCVTCVGLNLVLIGCYGVEGAALVAVITILTSGTIANFLIPSYRQIFYQQIKAIFLGWKNLIHIQQLLK